MQPEKIPTGEAVAKWPVPTPQELEHENFTKVPQRLVKFVLLSAHYGAMLLKGPPVKYAQVLHLVPFMVQGEGLQLICTSYCASMHVMHKMRQITVDRAFFSMDLL
jgi:hypothetical protein